MTDDREPGRDDASAAGDGESPDATPDTTPDTTPDATADATPEDDGRADSATSEKDEATGTPANESRWKRRRREKRAKPRRKAPWWEFPLLIAIAIGIAILVKSFIIQPFYIPSDSMEKTLHGCDNCSGDRILVNKPVYSVIRDPEPGDIVVFDLPSQWNSSEVVSTPPGNPIVRAVRGFGQLIGFVPPDGQVLVKRVIAVGGQTVRGVETDGPGGLTIDRVQISDSGAGGPWRTLNEPYTFRDQQHGNEMAFGPVTVPKGRLWVMGDHRNDSADSRFHCMPDAESESNANNCNPTSSTVPLDDVIGKAIVIAWPPSRWATLGTPSTFESSAALAGPGLPAAAPLAVVVPVAFVRRRRRRR